MPSFIWDCSFFISSSSFFWASCFAFSRFSCSSFKYLFISILFWFINSYFAFSVLFSIIIFFCCKYKFLNFSNFFLSSNFNPFLFNNLSMSSIFFSNSVKLVISSGWSDGINKSSSSILSIFSSSFLSLIFFSSSSSLSLERKSTMHSFSSNIWNNLSLSCKDIIFFPSISSLIILILFKTAPNVFNNKGPDNNFILFPKNFHFSITDIFFFAFNFCFKLSPVNIFSTFIPEFSLSFVFILSIAFTKICASEQNKLLYLLSALLSSEIVTGISSSEGLFSFWTDLALPFNSSSVNTFFCSPFDVLIINFLFFVFSFFSSIFSSIFSFFSNFFNFFCLTLLFALFSVLFSSLGIILFIIFCAILLSKFFFNLDNSLCKPFAIRDFNFAKFSLLFRKSIGFIFFAVSFFPSHFWTFDFFPEFKFFISCNLPFLPRWFLFLFCFPFLLPFAINSGFISLLNISWLFSFSFSISFKASSTVNIGFIFISFFSWVVFNIHSLGFKFTISL